MNQLNTHSGHIQSTTQAVQSFDRAKSLVRKQQIPHGFLMSTATRLMNATSVQPLQRTNNQWPSLIASHYCTVSVALRKSAGQCKNYEHKLEHNLSLITKFYDTTNGHWAHTLCSVDGGRIKEKKLLGDMVYSCIAYLTPLSLFTYN